jgi:hypothetical protein
MSIIQMHEGGRNPFINANNGDAVGQGLPTCNIRRDPTFHNTLPYKHIIKRFNQDDIGGGGCICLDCTPLVVGDVITLGEVAGGTALKDVLWDVFATDPTFQIDLEVRKVSDLSAAGVVLKAGVGAAVEDGMAFPNLYMSKYGVPCAGKDCYGQNIVPVPGGFDHGMIVAVVKALPTGAATGCKANCNPLGTLQFNLSYVVTDLR